MNFYRNDYLIEKILESVLTNEQKQLVEFTGKHFSKTEAKNVWERVVDHKWYVSEKLQRDIGLRVAAMDFVENIYNPTIKSVRGTNTRKSLFRKLTGTYFESKSHQTPL